MFLWVFHMDWGGKTGQERQTPVHVALAPCKPSALLPTGSLQIHEEREPMMVQSNMSSDIHCILGNADQVGTRLSALKSPMH